MYTYVYNRTQVLLLPLYTFVHKGLSGCEHSQLFFGKFQLDDFRERKRMRKRLTDKEIEDLLMLDDSELSDFSEDEEDVEFFKLKSKPKTIFDLVMSKGEDDPSCPDTTNNEDSITIDKPEDLEEMFQEAVYEKETVANCSDMVEELVSFSSLRLYSQFSKVSRYSRYVKQLVLLNMRISSMYLQPTPTRLLMRYMK